MSKLVRAGAAGTVWAGSGVSAAFLVDGIQQRGAATPMLEVIRCQSEADLGSLSVSGSLPPVVPPRPVRAQPARTPNRAALRAMAWCGGVCGATVFVITAAVAIATSQPAGVFFAVMAGLLAVPVGAFVPGIFIGFAAQRRSIGGHLRVDAHLVLVAAYWRREQLRQDLDGARISPRAAQVLLRDWSRGVLTDVVR